ncbi:hypothetical protein [Usitatibacter palustris]|uniref:IPT/TIG domain-containing protein n=1 Tax=Usitatibacter palustris TaxID=2732487 RepID=A0A6M4H2Y7_9PROT|nr:hypothetical protein [Usitatibacter palustris]QJR13941.1 hypothetical protein DSM104440_00733 [Usitatibacter palustris]
MKRNTTLALALACAFTSSAFADTIDLGALVTNQLKQTGKLATIYGGPVPAGTNTSIVFEGTVGGKGLKISPPGAIPDRPNVLLETPIGCAPVGGSSTVEVEGTTTDSTSFNYTDKVETSKEISVTVGYEAFGASASSTVTLGQTQGKENSKGGGTEKSKTWKTSRTIDVPPNRSFDVQFVVTERYLDAVPFTANFVVTGDVSINFLRGQEGYSWVKVTGTQLPPNVIRPGYQQNNRKLAVCRGKARDGTVWLGKSEGMACWMAIAVDNSFIPGIGWSTNDFEILVGAESSVALGDPYASDAYVTPGANPQKVCFAQHNGWSLPGYVRNTECISEWDSKPVRTAKYKILRAPQTGGVVKRVKIDDYLTEAQRTFNLRGVFSGVQAVRGDLRITEGPSCGPTAKTASAVTASAVTTSGLKAPAPAAAATVAPTAATKKLVLAPAKPGTKALPAAATVQNVTPVVGAEIPKK